MVFTAISLTIVLLILLITYYIYRTAFYSARHKHIAPDAPMKGSQYEAVAENITRITDIMSRYSFEPIRITALDGTGLFGRYYHFRDHAPLMLLMHGYRSHPYRDCAGGHALAKKLGYNVLVIDQRAHGDSQGSTITFGIKERHDCRCWIDYACKCFGSDTPIILSGLSMGAATVLMTADLNLPENVVCIMADCPYSSPSAIIEKVCRDMHYPAALCRPFLRLGAALYGGFDLTESSATEAVAHTSVPILLIHGEADRYVPCSMSHEIAANCVSRVELHTFPDAGHGLCYLTDPRRYERIVLHFLNSIPSLRGTVSDDFFRQPEK